MIFIETITSLTDYVEIVNQLSNKLVKDMFRNDTLLFRGQSNASNILLPPIGRKANDNVGNNLTWFESELIHETIRKLPDIFGDEKYSVDLLTKLQHYGIPTRLMDISLNAFVALYFACKVNENDGKVFVFKSSSDEGKYIYSHSDDIACIIAETYRVSHFSFSSFDKFIDELQYCNYTLIRDVFSLDDVKKESCLQYLFNAIQEPICITPLELTERQKRQQGAFFLFPNKTKNSTGLGRVLVENIEPIEEDNKWVQQIIRIPQEKNRLFKITYVITV